MDRVDPLTAKYPMLTPYQFASNRPIDGIDLDGLEHLNSEESRINVTSGGVLLKIENMTGPTKEAWRRAEMNSNNWTWNENGQQDIGISKKIASFDIITPVRGTSKADDVQETPSSLKSQEKYSPDPSKLDYFTSKKGTVSGKYNSNKVSISASSGGGFARGANGVMALVGLYQFAEENINSISWAYDKGQIAWDQIALDISIMQVNKAQEIPGLIPDNYRTQENIAAITNVVLQGVNNTKDPKIYEIGMKVYNTFNPPPKKEEDGKSK